MGWLFGNLVDVPSEAARLKLDLEMERDTFQLKMSAWNPKQEASELELAQWKTKHETSESKNTYLRFDQEKERESFQQKVTQ